MKLDPRIKSVSDILTCFDIEKATEFIGQRGYFADSLYCFDDLGSCYHDTLTDACDGQEVPFHRMESNNYQHFFIPESSLKPEEKKKWRPFTLDEFRAKFPLLSPVTFRRKTGEVQKTFCFVGYTANGAVILGSEWYSLNILFEDYELKDKDGNWTPFGVEDE